MRLAPRPPFGLSSRGPRVGGSRLTAAKSKQRGPLPAKLVDGLAKAEAEAERKNGTMLGR